MLKTAPSFVHLFVGGKSELLLPCYYTLDKVDQVTGLLLAQSSVESQLCELKVKTRAEWLPWFVITWHRRFRSLSSLIVPEMVDMVGMPAVRVVLNLDIILLVFMSWSPSSEVCIRGVS